MKLSTNTIYPVPSHHSHNEWNGLGPPAWTQSLLSGGLIQSTSLDRTVVGNADFTLVSVRVPAADDLSPADFEEHTADAYRFIASELNDRPARHPVRFWNYIPNIHRPSGDAIDRYMVFNAGRFSACSEWFGGPESFDRSLATASGVGHAASDLVIHALAAATPGIAVENPRQVPPYRYSRRFGPRPPCFARATVLSPRDGRRMILVGGTASIRGEESVHLGDVKAQTQETFINLNALVRHACEVVQDATVLSDSAPLLDQFSDLRIYHERPEDRETIAALLEKTLAGQSCRTEYVLADLCRPELLVEIEGVAEHRV